MGEVANVIVAFAVIVFLFKWVTSSSSGTPDRTAADTLGFRPKNATQDMVDTVSAMFPDIPPDNIRYDLLRTGNVELTTNKILEKGFLEAPPPAYYTLYPRTQNPAPARPAARNTAAWTSKQPQESLISRYSLQDRVANQKPDDPPVSEQEIGGKAVWEDTPEKREASLRERKAQMILAARQRLLAQQKQKQEANASASGVSTS